MPRTVGEVLGGPVKVGDRFVFVEVPGGAAFQARPNDVLGALAEAIESSHEQNLEVRLRPVDRNSPLAEIIRSYSPSDTCQVYAHRLRRVTDADDNVAVL